MSEKKGNWPEKVKNNTQWWIINALITFVNAKITIINKTSTLIKEFNIEHLEKWKEVKTK